MVIQEELVLKIKILQMDIFRRLQAIQLYFTKMKVDDIVFAPFKDSMWPGRIIAMGVMADVKFYKIKEHFKVPINSLAPFDSINIAINLERNKEKLFALAVKTAETQIKKRNKRESSSLEAKIEPVIKREEEEVRLPVKIEEMTMHDMVVKEEEQEVENVNHLPAYSSFLDFLLSVNEDELVKLAKKEDKHQWVYFSPQKQGKVSHQSNPTFQVIRLTEFMLARLLTLKNTNNKQTILTYQRKINLFLCNVNFPLKVLLSRDIIKLIKIVTDYHEASVLKWKNDNFVKSLKIFKEKIKVQVQNDLVDYSKLGPLESEVAKYRFLPKPSQ